MRTIATIELQGNRGRGELFVRGGDIWCRELDGTETCTDTVSDIETVDDAIKAIDASWRDYHNVWDLQYVDD